LLRKLQKKREEETKRRISQIKKFSL